MFHKKQNNIEKEMSSGDIGRIGEDIACNFLTGKGFLIATRNYRKKYGEIDIIALRGKTTYFIEVKSVSRENTSTGSDEHAPEENVHKKKMERIKKTIVSYVQESKHSFENFEWEFGVVCVYINTKKKTAQVRYMQDIIIE